MDANGQYIQYVLNDHSILGGTTITISIKNGASLPTDNINHYIADLGGIGFNVKYKQGKFTCGWYG